MFVEKGVKLLMKSGLPDKLTGGKATRFLTGLYNMFHKNEGVKSEYANNVAEVSKLTKIMFMIKIILFLS